MVTDLRSTQEKIRQLKDNLDFALQLDGECGAHWLNNLRAKEFSRNNPELIKWLNEFARFAKDHGVE